MAARIEYYRDTRRKWRWRVRSGHNIMADSGQGYVRRIDCVHGATVVGAALAADG